LVFPVADWSFHLLAMLNAAVALYAVDCIARRYLNGDRRLLALLLLLFTPFYQFHGQRFGSNQMLLSTWPIATYCFLRAFESRGVVWAAAAGATAALAMLGKYYSVYLIAGFVAAALWHPARWRYLRSLSPWISVLAGLIVLGPHLYWLAATGSQPISYALAVHGRDPTAVVLENVIGYAAGAIGYMLLPILVYWLAVRPDRHALTAAVRSVDPDRQMLVVLLAVPLVLPILTAPLFGISLTSLWSMQAWFLLPIILLAPKEVQLGRGAAVRVALGLVAFTTIMLALAPVLAFLRHTGGTKEGRGYFQPVSEELTRAWRAAFHRPLTIVTGHDALGTAVTFYSDDHPDSVPSYLWEGAPWITAARRSEEGWAVICEQQDQSCLASAERNTTGESDVRRITYDVAVSFLGVRSAPAQFVFLLVPPKSSASP